jgi:hypothetical protein
MNEQEQAEVQKLRDALQFYADASGHLWEPCPDDHEHGLRRLYITGTCHPNQVARRALGLTD